VSNNISNKLLSEFYGQNSSDPFLMFVTLSHPSFSPIYLVDNTVNLTSRGIEYQAFPMRIRLPVDDGETARAVNIEFDNASLELIEELRSITTPIEVKLEMILASELDSVQIALENLTMTNITYDKQKIMAMLSMDGFLDTELTSESYTPQLYPGLF